MWLVLVKIYGRRPKTLLNKIKENNAIKIKEFPILIDFLPIRVENSEWRVEVILFQIKLICEGAIQ